MIELHHRLKNVVSGGATLLHWSPDSARTILWRMERWAARRPDDPFLWFEGRQWSIGEFNAEVNRHAAAWRALGVQPGDVVALMMDNRPSFLLHFYGIQKARAVASLINPNLTAHPLVHAVTSCDARALVLGDRQREAVADVAEQLGLAADRICIDAETALEEEAFSPWGPKLEGASQANPEDVGEITLGDTAAFIYTSGTTGLPKPAIVKHHRLWRIGKLMAAGLRAAPSDGIYNCLPLYHSNGVMVAASFALVAGCRYALGRRFSASGFWRDCVESDATVFIYIGEICRYLHLTDPGPYDRAHRVQTIVGNGLRPDLWEAFCERFGVDRVFEFYGSTEGNAETANLFNATGSCGVMIPGKMALARYDLERGEVVRNARGFVEKAGPGEPGLLLGKIKPKNEFAGYTDPAATDRKVLRDVFRKGDAWFDTGDLLRRDRLRRLYFVDRIGDTFRWRGENVSTNEVAEQLHQAPTIAECNVYGVLVPGNEGRAGMAAVVLDGALDGPAVYAHLDRTLPAYAQPRVLRVVESLETTGTFKHKKGELRDQGFDPADVSDALWLRDPREGTYVALTPERYREVVQGRWPV